jgi:hypothetical protein
MKTVRILTLTSVLALTLGTSVRAGDMGSPGYATADPTTTSGTDFTPTCGDMGSPGAPCSSSQGADDLYTDLIIDAMSLY